MGESVEWALWEIVCLLFEVRKAFKSSMAQHTKEEIQWKLFLDNFRTLINALELNERQREDSYRKLSLDDYGAKKTETQWNENKNSAGTQKRKTFWWVFLNREHWIVNQTKMLQRWIWLIFLGYFFYHISNQICTWSPKNTSPSIWRGNGPSTTSTSFENRTKILPVGLTQKNFIGSRKILTKSTWWSSIEALSPPIFGNKSLNT